MITTLFLFNDNPLIVPRGDYADASEVIGVDYRALDGTLAPDIWGVKWGLKLELLKDKAVLDAIWALYLSRAIFPVRDEDGVTRPCLITLGNCTWTRVHRGVRDPLYKIQLTIREQ
jgi:hypothetical protein